MKRTLHCPRCSRQWSVDAAKLKQALACPDCKAGLAPVGLPADPPGAPSGSPAPKKQAPERQPSGGVWSEPGFRIAALAGGALVVLVAVLALVLVLSDLGQGSTPTAQATPDELDEPPVTRHVPRQTHSQAGPTSPGPKQTDPPPRETGLQPKPTGPSPKQTDPAPPPPDPTPPKPVGKDVPQTGPTKPQPPPKQPDPAPVKKPPGPAVAFILDDFGNPEGDGRIGLGEDGEFEGKRILVWCASEGYLAQYFAPTSPLWQALKKKGFTLDFRQGRFDPRVLKAADQLWIISSPDPATLSPPRVYEAQLQALSPAPAGKPDPFGDWRIQFRALLAAGKRARSPDMGEAGYDAVVKYVRSGKGLFLLAENDPWTLEANALAKRLFDTGIKGNYIGEKIAYVRERKLSPEQVRQYKGDFAVSDHALLTGVNFLFEGYTVANFRGNDRLEVVMRASDGKPLIGVSRVPGERVVIDCGYTRYVHGTSKQYQLLQRTAGTVRFAENVAAYLMGKGR